MDLIGLYFLQTLKQRFNPKRQPWNLVGMLFFIGLGGFYGFVFGKVLSEVGSIAEKETILTIIQWVLTLGIVLFSFVKTFIPYKTLPTSFSRHLPVSHIQRLVVGLVGEFLTPFFMGLLSFLILFFVLAGNLPIWILVNSISVLIGSLMSRRIFQLSIERHWRGGISSLKWIALFCGMLGLALLFSPLLEQIKNLFSYSASIGLVFLAYSLFIVESYICVIPKERRPFRLRIFKQAPIHIKVLFGGANSRLMVVFGIFYKVIFVALFASMGEAQESDSFLIGGPESAIIVLMLMPIQLFSYIFNNTWGFLPNYWLFIERSSTKPIDIFKEYLNILKWPIGLDYLLLCLYCIIFPTYTLELQLGYLLCIFFCAGLGFLASAIAVKKVTKAFKMGGNTAQWANFLIFIPTMVAYVIRLNVWFYGLYVLVFLMSLAMIYYGLASYKTKRQQIYQKLFS